MNRAAERRIAAFFYVLVFLIPFGTRKLLYQFTPGFHEYETAFLYLNDILLALFVVTTLMFFRLNRGKSESKSSLWPELRRRPILFLFLFMFASAMSIFFADNKWLAAHSFARLLQAALFALCAAYVIKQGIIKIEKVFAVVAGAAALQSLIAFFQFARQGSLGLRWLGESVLGPNIPGVAKISLNGVNFIRASGTLPHPNILAAFMLLGLISLGYLWMRKKEAAVIATFFAILLGLLLTFSRAAWLIALALTLFVTIRAFIKKYPNKILLVFLLVLLAGGYALVANLRPFVILRGNGSALATSVADRITYNKLGLELVKEKPFGVGIGNQVSYSVRNDLYQKFSMDKVWQWEPIHNLYLLMASEIGILGLAVFILFLAMLIISNFQYLIFNEITSVKNIVNFAALTMISSLLLFGLTDHFLWTLQPGRLMLWLAIGLVWGAVGLQTESKVE